ncbi:MAG: DUF58 domain-containing protein [Agathobacter sp.]|nr:DUF58 domain-containing protein [Agathobacter sp.]
MYWILLLGLALAWGLQTFLIHHMWRRWLTVRLQFCERYIYEGDSSVLQEVVINDKWLPLPALEVRIAMSRHLAFTGKKRSCYKIKQADLKAYDFFFRTLDYGVISQDTMLYVYPAQVDTRRLNIITTAISGTILVQNQLFPDPFEFAGIREYQPTDPMNRMNWKAEALVEETIRIVSSLATRLVAARMPVELYGNAAVVPEKKGLFAMHLPANASHIAKLNQQLACIGGYTMPCTELLESFDSTANTEQMMVFISKNTDDEIVQKIGSLASAASPVLWVIPKSPYTEQPAITLPFVRTLFWEVEL